MSDYKILKLLTSNLTSVEDVGKSARFCTVLRQACIKTSEDPGGSAHVNIQKCTETILEIN
jgi:hypothetical protein